MPALCHLFLGKPSQLREGALTSFEEVIPFSSLPPPAKEKKKNKNCNKQLNYNLKQIKKIQKFGKIWVLFVFTDVEASQKIPLRRKICLTWEGKDEETYNSKMD